MGHKLKLAITFDPVLLPRVDAAAKSLGISRSKYIEQACLTVLNETEHVGRALGNEAVREAFFRAMTDPKVLRGMSEAMGLDLTPQQEKLAAKLLPAVNKEMKDEYSGRSGGKSKRPGK